MAKVGAVRFRGLVNQRQPLSAKLNWRKYFERFCEAHGEDPVNYKGRLLFKDGWQYSASNYAGPEWPPPKHRTKLKQLKKAYWTERRKQVKEELDLVDYRYKALKRLQETKSVPLQQTGRHWSDDEERIVTEVYDAEFAAFEDRLEWLRTDLEECDNEILENT